MLWREAQQQFKSSHCNRALFHMRGRLVEAVAMSGHCWPTLRERDLVTFQSFIVDLLQR